MSTKYSNIVLIPILLIAHIQLCYPQNKWTPVDGLYGGSVVSMTLDSSKNIFAATESNTVLFSTNDGDSWTPTNFPSNLAPFVLVSTSHAVFVGTDGAGIYQSTDQGKSWNYVGLSGATVLSLEYLKDGSLFAGLAYYNGLYRSTDNGNSWNYFGLSGYYVYSVITTSNGLLFAAVQDSTVMRTTDNGVSWTRTLNPYGFTENGRTLAVDKNENVYAGLPSGVWRTTDGGETWSVLGALMSYVNDIVFTDSSIFVCGAYGILKGSSGGKNWATIDSLIYGVQTNSIVITSKNNIVTGSRWRGFTRSTDDGISWEQINDNFRHSSVSSLAYSHKNIFAGITWDGVYFSSDVGKSWQHIWNSINIPNAILADDSVLIVAPTNGNYGLYRSSDLGKSWIPTNVESGVFYCLTKTQNGIYFAGKLGGVELGVYSSTDKGVTWEWKLKDYSIWSITSTPSGYIFAGTVINGIYRTVDSGKSWTNAGLNTGTIRCLASDSLGNVYASPGDGYVYRSTNNGESWDTVGMNFNSPVNNILILNESSLIAGTDSKGVFISKDYGVHWNEINSGLPMQSSNIIRTENGSIFLSSAGNGLFRSTDSTLLFIKGPSYDFPSKYFLQNNYPNPFNPTTTIKYQVPSNSFVSLSVYDVIGREIKKLVNEQQNAGEYVIKFDGNKLSTGIYFYRLETKNFSETKKMLLVK